MKICVGRRYPGEAASLLEQFALAETYEKAAKELQTSARSRSLDHLPVRLTAIHAIELYLSTYLILQGQCAKDTRAHMHNLFSRAVQASESGLILRKATLSHLQSMSDGRDYLIVRYGPEKAKGLCPQNRVMASLNEVATKVRTALINSKAACPSGSQAVLSS